MERETSNARYARLHAAKPWHDGRWGRWSAEPSEFTPVKFDMGVTIGVADTDLRPGDLFLTVESADPHAPPEAESEPDDESVSDA